MTIAISLHCKGRCRLDNFPLELIMTKDEHKHPRTASNYNYKHRLNGQAKCNNCNYITAKPIKQGTRCPCCSKILARSIYHKGNKMLSEHKRIE